MWTVAVKLARVASQLDWIDAGDEPKLPFIGRSSLLDVVDMAQTLEMFVGFAVQLKVGFEIGFVVAKLAKVIASNHDGHLVFPGVTSILRQVV